MTTTTEPDRCPDDLEETLARIYAARATHQAMLFKAERALDSLKRSRESAPASHLL